MAGLTATLFSRHTAHLCWFLPCLVRLRLGCWICGAARGHCTGRGNPIAPIWYRSGWWGLLLLLLPLGDWLWVCLERRLTRLLTSCCACMLVGCHSPPVTCILPF